MYLGDLHEEHGVPKLRKKGSRCSIALSLLLTFVIICICHQLLEPVDQASIHASRSLQSEPHDRHPDKVVAVVQYDNPDRISLLDCYLKRDLTAAHGPLSSVIFLAHPAISLSDSHALNNLLSTSPHYSRVNISSTTSPPNFLPEIAERSTLYITIPSTTVYIRPHALAHLITSKLLHPTQRLTIANSITAGSTIPAKQPPSSHRRTAAQTLRTVSDLPLSDAESMTWLRAPVSAMRGYRSLLLSRLAETSHHPAHQRDATDPEEDARTHYAFMHSLSLGRLDEWVRRSRAIDATSADGLASWMGGGNVVAVWGDDAMDIGKAGSVWEESEVWMDGTAVVALWDGVEGTEVLEQWDAYAKRVVCPPPPRSSIEEAKLGDEEGMELKR